MRFSSVCPTVVCGQSLVPVSRPVIGKSPHMGRCKQPLAFLATSEVLPRKTAEGCPAAFDNDVSALEGSSPKRRKPTLYAARVITGVITEGPRQSFCKSIGKGDLCCRRRAAKATGRYLLRDVPSSCLYSDWLHECIYTNYKDVGTQGKSDSIDDDMPLRAAAAIRGIPAVDTEDNAFSVS